MSQSIYANDGQIYNIGDINVYTNVGGHQWATFMVMHSDPIFISTIKSWVADLPYPSIFNNITQQVFDDAKAGDPTTITALESEGVWFTGDWFNGGFVFFNGSTADTIGFAFVRAMDDCPSNDYEYWFYYGNQSQPSHGNEIDPQDSQVKDYDYAICFLDEFKIDGVMDPTAWGVIIGCPEIAHWVVTDNALKYERNSVNDSIQRTSIEAGDFVTDLITFYKTTFMVDAVTNLNSGLPYHAKYEWWKNAEKPKPDPYKQGGYSSPEGGDGSFDNDSHDIPVPDLPPDTLLNCGIIKMYQPSEAEMRQFMNFIYSSPTSVIDNFKKLWVNPMESIISFALSPIEPSVGTAEEVKFCGVGSNISMNPLNTQYMQVDCGSTSKIISKFFGSALDYNNYTKVSIFLPFIGFCPLPSDEIIGSTVNVKYNIDFFTGECVAFVHVTKYDVVGGDDRGDTPDDPPNDIHYASVLHSYKGNILAQVPITGNNYQGLYQSVLNAVTAIGTGAASAMSGNIAGGIAGVASTIGSNLMGQKVEYQRSGTLAGNGGQLGEYFPYVIVERPIQSVSSDFVDKRGYPSNCCDLIKNTAGYFEIIPGTFQPDLYKSKQSYGVTKGEIDMIEEILQTGAVIND